MDAVSSGWPSGSAETSGHRLFSSTMCRLRNSRLVHASFCVVTECQVKGIVDVAIFRRRLEAPSRGPVQPEISLVEAAPYLTRRGRVCRRALHHGSPLFRAMLDDPSFSASVPLGGRAAR